MPLVQERVRFLVVHCSASPPSAKVDASVIDRWHRERGFLKIGYHYVINRDGRVEKGRDLTEIGAHVEGYNAVSVGICLVGGVNEKNIPEKNFTGEQFDALTVLLHQTLARFPNCEVLGHRDIPGVKKACPSFDVKPWWAVANI
jgi:N-acetylmuramoyl-L-alanine amidase